MPCTGQLDSSRELERLEPLVCVGQVGSADDDTVVLHHDAVVAGGERAGDRFAQRGLEFGGGAFGV